MRYLIPVDDSSASIRAAEHVAALADPSSEVVLLSVGPTLPRHVSRVLPVAARDALRSEKAAQRFSGPREVLQRAGIPVTTRIAKGAFGEAVADTARAESASQVVLGTRRQAPWMSLLGASRADAVIDASPVPVAVIADGRPSPLERFGVPAGLGLGLTALVLSAE